MSGIGQYLKDTRGELRQVAWPTRTQTIIYTILVAALSVGVALYLGFFDFVFTSGLTQLVNYLPQNGTATEQLPATQPSSTNFVQGSPIQIVSTTTNSH
jgi:preprotein translocase SecE subunit